MSPSTVCGEFILFLVVMFVGMREGRRCFRGLLSSSSLLCDQLDDFAVTITIDWPLSCNPYPLGFSTHFNLSL